MNNPESSDDSPPLQLNAKDAKTKKSHLTDGDKNKLTSQNMVYYDKCKLLTAPAAASVPIF